MFHHAMKSQGRVMLPVALLAATVLLSACGHHSTNSPPSTVGAPRPASPVSTPHGAAVSATQTAAVGKTPVISSPGSTSPMPAPQGSAASATQAAGLATTPTFKEVTAGQILVTLAQTAKPTIPTYLGVQPDIDGIRIGMTVSQAEAIAAKTFSGKPDETRKSLNLVYFNLGVTAQSQSFISSVEFHNGDYDKGHDDALQLGFSNPVSGNVLYIMSRDTTTTDTSKEPLVTVVTSDLIKKYGTPSSRKSDSYGWQYYKWQFGEQSLKSCDGPCKASDEIGGAVEVDARLLPDSNDKTKAREWGVSMTDLQFANSHDDVTVASNEIRRAIVEYYNSKLSETNYKAMYVAKQKLLENASNILDVTGAITGHALVVSCPDVNTNNYVSAQTLSGADPNSESFYTTFNISKEAFQKYGLGPIVYDGKKYDMIINASGDPPKTTNARVSLEPFNTRNPAVIRSYNGLVGGSIAVDVAGYSEAFTFDHAALKLESADTQGPSVPPNTTVTINGKVYCQGSVAPLLLNRSVPAQALTGTYVNTAAQRGSVEQIDYISSLDFVSGTKVDIHVPVGTIQATYDNYGNQLFINFASTSAPFKMDGDGCIESSGYSKFCKK